MSSSAHKGLSAFASEEAEQKLADKMKSLALQEKEREVEARAESINLSYIDLRGFPINPDSIAIIPKKIAASLGVVCFWYAIGDLRVGVINPKEEGLSQYLALLSREHYTNPIQYLISEESFRVALKAYDRAPKFRAVERGITIHYEDLERTSANINSLKDLAVTLKSMPATEAVTMMIAGGIKTRASDIHLEAEEKGVTLRYRIDGVLYNVATIPTSESVKALSRLKLLSGLKINVANRPQDGRFTIHRGDSPIDVRVSSLPTAFGESIVMRLLLGAEKGVHFENLGLVGSAHDQLVAEMKRPNGMILATGPTGSGKTTTLYAIITDLNSAEIKIITIEDPIEYKLPGVNQSQVDSARGYTFANGLESILRQDPNIIMVGEIRDTDTATIAVQAALTGHLVLSTLHTNNAAGAIPRLLSLGVSPALLPSSLNAVIGQRLVRRICESCKQVDTPEPQLIEEAERVIAKLGAKEKTRLPKKIQYMKGAGCENCQGLGYRGQIGIFEVLLMSQDLKKAIVENRASDTEVEEIANANSMVTMAEDGVLKALAGITTLSEVFRVTKE